MHRSMPMMAPPPLSSGAIGAAFAMWSLMMVAMMLPSALPMILLHAKLAKSMAASGAFALSYVAVWTAASLVAALVQQELIAANVLGPMSLAVGDRRMSGALLIAAGLYQLSPLKGACLANCRSPVSFLMRGWRPGVRGALRLGTTHGAYCVGCCWMLMTLLFVGGVMNLAWVAAIAAIVLVEKILPGGQFTARLIGWSAAAAGAALLLCSASAATGPPVVQATTIDGASFDSAALRGSVVVVNFWATWCAPCRAEMPAFDRYYRAQRQNGLAMLALSMDDSSKAKMVHAIAADFAFPVALVGTARVSGPARPSRLPVTLVFDRAGVLRFDSRNRPATILDAAALDRIVGPLLAAH